MPNLEGKTSAVREPISGRDALAAVRTELLAMKEVQITWKITLDPSAAARVASGSAYKIEIFRAELRAQFGARGEALLDMLPTIAEATREADFIVFASAPRADVPAMHAELRRLHHLMMTDARALVLRKLLDGRRLDRVRDTKGHQTLIQSVLVLIAILRGEWKTIEAHTPLTTDTLAQAELAAMRLSTELGARLHGAPRTPAVDLRARALSTLVQVHDELRGMISYLRWRQRDVDDFMPSLWAQRGRRKRTRREASEGDAPPRADGRRRTPAADGADGPFTE